MLVEPMGLLDWWYEKKELVAVENLDSCLEVWNFHYHPIHNISKISVISANNMVNVAKSPNYHIDWFLSYWSYPAVELVISWFEPLD